MLAFFLCNIPIQRTYIQLSELSCQMVQLGFFLTSLCRAACFEPKSVSRVAPDWYLWRPLNQLSYKAAAWMFNLGNWRVKVLDWPDEYGFVETAKRKKSQRPIHPAGLSTAHFRTGCSFLIEALQPSGLDYWAQLAAAYATRQRSKQDVRDDAYFVSNYQSPFVP